MPHGRSLIAVRRLDQAMSRAIDIVAIVGSVVLRVAGVVAAAVAVLAKHERHCVYTARSCVYKRMLEGDLVVYLLSYVE